MGLLLLDLRKFFDSIGLVALWLAANQKGYHLRLLALLLQLYQTKRVVQCDAVFGEWVAPLQSIIAGCGEACNMAKCALHQLAVDVTIASPDGRFSLLCRRLQALCNGPLGQGSNSKSGSWARGLRQACCRVFAPDF